MERVIPAAPATATTARAAGALGAGSTGLGAAIVTVVAGTCCVSPVLAPLVVGALGAAGAAWAAGLKPYSGYILAGSVLLLAGGFWSVYRHRSACAVGAGVTRLRRWLSRLAKGVLWVGAASWVGAVIVHLMLP
jgi:hypothetical protein